MGGACTGAIAELSLQTEGKKFSFSVNVASYVEFVNTNGRVAPSMPMPCVEVYRIEDDGEQTDVFKADYLDTYLSRKKSYIEHAGRYLELKVPLKVMGVSGNSVFCGSIDEK